MEAISLPNGANCVVLSIQDEFGEPIGGVVAPQVRGGTPRLPDSLHISPISSPSQDLCPLWASGPVFAIN